MLVKTKCVECDKEFEYTLIKVTNKRFICDECRIIKRNESNKNYYVPVVHTKACPVCLEILKKDNSQSHPGRCWRVYQTGTYQIDRKYWEKQIHGGMTWDMSDQGALL